MTPTIHWPLTHHPHRPIRPTNPTQNPADLTISPLYDILQYSNHIFSEISWHPLSTALTHCVDHFPITHTDLSDPPLTFWVSHSCTTSSFILLFVQVLPQMINIVLIVYVFGCWNAQNVGYVLLIVVIMIIIIIMIIMIIMVMIKCTQQSVTYRYREFFIGGPFEAQIMIWRQIQIFSPNRRALFHSTPEGPIDRATKF